MNTIDTKTDPAVMQTTLQGYPKRQGKVRDIYDLGDRLLLVTTDRISAFDVVMPNGVPHKGKVLTQIADFWFKRFADIPNHVIEVIGEDPPAEFKDHADELKGRALLCKKCEVVPIECVIRGYITGSGWKEYQKTGTVCGIKLPDGLQQCAQLPEPIFTPATKAEEGHDENISFETACDIAGKDVMEACRERSMRIYTEGAAYARERGVIIADTKFEFGYLNGELLLIDEVLTPDSSRFWPADQYAPGRDQDSYDKQYVRNYLETLDWDKKDPGPRLPDDIIANTLAKYADAFERITGKKFIP